MVKKFVLFAKDYIMPKGEDVTIIDYDVNKLIEGHIAEIAESLNLKEWFAIYLCGSYFTNCYTSSKKGILLTDIPSNEVARIDCNWNNEPILLFAGSEESAGLKYKSKPSEKSNSSISAIRPDYESLANLKTITGRAVKIKNPIHNFGIGGAWVEGIGDINVGSFTLPSVDGKDLVKLGFDVDPDFNYERFTFDYPTKNIVLDKESTLTIKDIVNIVLDKESTLAIRDIVRKAHQERVELVKKRNPKPENAMTESERRKKEIQWDNLYNEGGEGYNPYRADEVLSVIEPQDV